MFWDKKQIFSIRKTSLGIGSVLLGLVLLAPTVAADEVSNQDTVGPATSVGTTTTPTVATDEVPNQDTVQPATSVGTTTDSTVAADEVPNQDTVRPTTSVETTTGPTSVSIQPKVETSTIPATSEYLADETLDYGDTKVVIPTVDGTTETVTTYKEIEKVVDIVDQSAKDTMASTDYKYGSTDFYHIDDTQEKPSDKIIIDRIFSDVKPLTTEEINTNQSIRDIVTGSEYSGNQVDPQKTVFVEFKTDLKALLRLTSLDGSKPDIYLSSESLNPDNHTLQNLLKDYSFEGNLVKNLGTWSGEMTDELKSAVYYELLRTASSSLSNLAGFNYINELVEDDRSEAAAVKGYYTSQLPITEELYADAKANYARYQLALSSLNIDPDRLFAVSSSTSVYRQYVKSATPAFETITKRYNDANGTIQNPVRFEDTALLVDSQVALVEKISQLPEAIKANLLKLIVTDSVMDVGDWARGVTYFASNEIQLRQFSEREFLVLTNQGKKEVKIPTIQPFDLFDNFLHELGHAIDNMSGKVDYDYYAYQPEDGQVKSDLRLDGSPTTSMRSMGRLSYSNDFLKVFEEYFVNKEDVWEYIRWTPSEAWADSLGEYINHKIFGSPYTRYKKIDGVVYSYNPDLAGQNAEYDAMKETVYDVGYSPVEASEFYWESIYKKLFEPEVIKETVVDGVTTNITPAQNGKVLVGTKPKVTVESISFKTVEESDASQPVGYRVVKQAGQNGQLETKTTYTVDSKTGQVTETTSTTVLQDTIDEIILVGIKEVTEEISEKPEVTVGTTIEVLAYASREETDSSQPIGYRYTKQVGENGLVKVTITNTKDPKTGQITTEVEREILKAAIDEIVVLGTKVVEEEPKNPSQPINNNEDLQPVVKEELVSKSPVTIPMDEKNSSLVARNTETDNSVKQITGEVITKTHHNPTAVLVNAHSTKTSTLPATGEKESSFISLLGMTSLAGGLALAASHRRGKYMD
ncbi:LPXTG cell wall anchor domain-containing protein [Streptococcus suis]|nr:LPXTG cell wall anchor domain-containing protein [Streptococcus suis]NQJ77266.1 LPXTG cell wall anchor domain-containing protein [Streptococcus suis]